MSRSVGSRGSVLLSGLALLCCGLLLLLEKIMLPVKLLSLRVHVLESIGLKVKEWGADSSSKKAVV